jgi:hypothetical protein
MAIRRVGVSKPNERHDGGRPKLDFECVCDLTDISEWLMESSVG